MVKVEGTDNIYMYTVPDDIDEIYNMVIFHNIYGGDANQTISLSYIDTKLGYRINGYSDGKRIGYWYLQDKTDILNKLNTLYDYQHNKEYYTSSYSNLDEIITNIEREINGEIKLEKDNNYADKYYLLVDVLFKDADEIINNLEVNTDKLSDEIEELENELSDYERVYTKDSVDNLEEIINELKDLLENGNVTVDDIKNGIKDLNDLKDDLKRQANKENLLKEIEDISKLDKNKYQEDTFNNLEQLLIEANKINDDTNVNQEEVDEIVLKLKKSRENLKEKEEVNEDKEKIIEEKEELKEEFKENINEEIISPKTLDNIVKIFVILGICIVGLIVLIIFMKKSKK